MPYRRVTLTTPLHQREVLEALSGAINCGTFTGIVSGTSFRLERVIKYRNSFLPVIDGNVEHSGSGAVVHVRMRLGAFTIAFLIIWFVFLGLSLVNNLIRGEGGPDTPLVICGMLLFGAGLTLGGFYYEVPITIRELRAIVASEEMGSRGAKCRA